MKWPAILGCVVILTCGVPGASLAQMQGPDQGVLGMPVEMNKDLSKVPIEVPLRGGKLTEVPLRRSSTEPPLPQVPLLQGAPQVPGQHPDSQAVKRPEFSVPHPNFDGIKVFDPGAEFIPPDTNGDVSRSHYVQVVNSSIEIFDKQGTRLAGPMPINVLFAPLSGPCATGSVIDPIVNYDPLDDRWVVMGFPFASPICIAVSKTADPVTGGWFLYAFDAVGDPDYPKLGVWPDAYYLTTQRGFASGGLDVYALDRPKMLKGEPATFIHFFVEPPSLFLLPADLDGRPPKHGTPAPFVRHVDGGLWGGVDRLEVYEFSVNFSDPGSSTFKFDVGLPTDPFSAVLCGDDFFGNCAEQPNGVLLETLPAWLMWRLQYRNFGGYETLVTSHTINVDLQDHAGIRWYELRRRNGKPWAIYQQGTFAPQDPAATSFLHRWMGSIAMDEKGNIALGFSASSSAESPSIRYVGRMASDPLGLMPQGGPPNGDFLIVAGQGAQFSTRWGDYSSMNIDPADGCTFWYTQEYIGADDNWRTRIAAFRFPTCHPVKVAGKGAE